MGLRSRGDRGAGVPLTERERRRLDFTRTTVVHARWCKAAAHEAGVRPWLDHYDPDLTVSEHVSVYAGAGYDPENAPTLRATSPGALADARRRHTGGRR